MKKATMILTLVFGIFLISNTAVEAINPFYFHNLSRIADSELIIEKDIQVQDWMLSKDVFSTNSINTITENDIRLESWMLGQSGLTFADQPVIEQELLLEDWMLQSATSYSEHRAMVLEDWMTRIII